MKFLNTITVYLTKNKKKKKIYSKKKTKKQNIHIS